MGDPRIATVLEHYHERIEKERESPPDEIDDRLLAVGPETGRLINILARSLDAPMILELGTSYGYSGIWLAAAARERGGRVISMELAPHKAAYARAMAEKAGLGDWIEHRVGDAVEMIAALDGGIDFVLLDLWKNLYEPCLRAFAPKLRPGAIIVADNMSRGRSTSEGIVRYSRAIRAVAGIETVRLPVGAGIDVSCFGG
jgi:predicted O-methyltransferase YrrM